MFAFETKFVAPMHKICIHNQLPPNTSPVTCGGQIADQNKPPGRMGTVERMTHIFFCTDKS